MLKKAVMLLLAALMTVSLTSCSPATPPDEVVKAYLGHFKAAEFVKMIPLMVTPERGFNVGEIKKLIPGNVDFPEMLKKMTYKVGQPTINEDHAGAPVKTTSVDQGSGSLTSMTRACWS